MSKSILVIDTPSKCTECPLHEMSGDFDSIICVPVQKLRDKFADGHPDWCPIKLIPEKKDMEQFSDIGNAFANFGWKALGWNACIDEILKQ